MEYKNIYLNFTVQPQTEYKNIKIETCSQGLLPWDMSLQSNQKIYSTKVSYCQNSDIRIIFRKNSDFSIKHYLVVRGRSWTSAISINGDIHYNI